MDMGLMGMMYPTLGRSHRSNGSSKPPAPSPANPRRRVPCVQEHCILRNLILITFHQGYMIQF
eukprot:848152-Amphidinium_carterae.1